MTLKKVHTPLYNLWKKTQDPGEGGHFHIASDMDVRQIRVPFLALKSAKGCHFQATKVSNFSKITIFFDQITEILRNSFKNAKIYS